MKGTGSTTPILYEIHSCSPRWKAADRREGTGHVHVTSRTVRWRIPGFSRSARYLPCTFGKAYSRPCRPASTSQQAPACRCGHPGHRHRARPLLLDHACVLRVQTGRTAPGDAKLPTNSGQDSYGAGVTDASSDSGFRGIFSVCIYKEEQLSGFPAYVAQTRRGL
jgi:hypothetical protein